MDNVGDGINFRLMKETGLEMARLWVYWRRHERLPGQYNFDEVDRLFDLAEQNGVHICLLLFLESQPEWFIRQFPETWFVKETRERFYPSNRQSSPIGGMSVCNNHPLFRE